MRRLVAAWFVIALLGACSSEEEPRPVLPDALPFEYSRPDRGQPLTTAEVDTFTKRITGFWKDVDYFNWVLSVSHGVHASTGMPDYAVWWQDIEAIKEGELVTFRHSERGGAHNIYIPTPRLLAQAASGYLLTKDLAMGRLVERFAKGITAACKGMVWDESDPNIYLMARNIVTHNHTYDAGGGRMKAVDYSGWYTTYEQWNAQRLHFPNNPYWGDIYVTNMRSKDDVPHIFLAAPFLRYVLEYGEDTEVVAAARESYEFISGFAKDIVDSGYKIRTKDAEGKPWIPSEDLASFVDYESLIANGECTSKLSAALLGYGEPKGNDCGRAEGNDYEGLATSLHYYNYEIVKVFHLSAIMNALVNRHDAIAERMVKGLGMRVDRYSDPKTEEEGASQSRWVGDLASFMIQGAAVGLPLTSENARAIIDAYETSLDDFETWPNWDLWDSSIADGTYGPDGGYKPQRRPEGINVQDMAFFLEYCFSPFRNPAGVSPVNCDIVADRDRWGR